MSLSLPEWLRFVEAHPHDFTIQYPVRREYFLHNFRRMPAPRARDWLEDAPEALLYLHVPFCEAKCFYCNFAVDVSADEQVHTGYVDALLRELASHADWLSRTKIRGIDIGGGTPTRLPAKQLARLCQAIAPYAQDSGHAFPVSIETTPRIASQEPAKLDVLRHGGVQRVSMGVQSFNAATLALVNRRRQVEQTEQAMSNLRAAGFRRLNLDIIFGLPGQTMQDWLADLDHVIALAPDLVFWIAGADPHEDDRFGQMRLNDGHFATRDEHVLNLVTRGAIPTVVLYGGGYNRDREHTARLHASTVLRAAAYT